MYFYKQNRKKIPTLPPLSTHPNKKIPLPFFKVF